MVSLLMNLCMLSRMYSESALFEVTAGIFVSSAVEAFQVALTGAFALAALADYNFHE